jgi:hypothetical protein
MKLIFVLSLLALPAASFAAKPAVRQSIPKAFLGDWVLEALECAPGPSSNGNMRLTAKRIINFESLGKVSRVEIFDPSTIRVSSQITHGGGAFGSIETMSLSTDGKSLTIGEMSDMSVYKRCTK